MAVASKSKEGDIIARLQGAVSERWPEARFKIGEMPEGGGTAILAFVDADFWDVCDATKDLEFEAMDRDSIFVYTIPMPAEAWED